MTSEPACDLLVLDLDGTLLNRAGGISRRNAEAIAAAEAAGIQVVIATGRSWSESRHVLGEIGYRRPFIAAGGAVLADGRTGRTTHREAMDAGLVGSVVATLLAHRHTTLLLKDAPTLEDEYVIVGEGPLDRASEWWFDTFRIGYRRVATLADDPHPGDTVRIGVVASGVTLVEVAAEVRREVGDRAFMQHWSAVTAEEATGSTTHLLEVFSPKVSKWTAIVRLCAMLGIDPRRTVAIGDGLNDVEMIANAGCGIAMANACPSVLEVAQMVTGHHDEDGVAEAILGLVNGEWGMLNAEC